MIFETLENEHGKKSTECGVMVDRLAVVFYYCSSCLAISPVENYYCLSHISFFLRPLCKTK